MIERKCYRCGKIHEFPNKKITKAWECAHCHARHILDFTSQRQLKYVQMLFVGIVVGALLYGCGRLHVKATTGGYIALIIACSLALLLTKYSDQFCLWLGDKLFKFRYIPLEEYQKQVNKKKTKGK